MNSRMAATTGRMLTRLCGVISPDSWFCRVMRSRTTRSIFSKSMFKNMNWWLVGSFVVTTALTLIAVYLPGLSDEVFDIERGTFQINELLISAGLAASTIPVFEIGKAIRRAVERKKERNAA